jgi:hypothetical protein
MLRRVVDPLHVEETSLGTFPQLSKTLETPEETLRKGSESEEGLVQAAQELKLDDLLAQASEPLRRAKTGKEAIHDMLQIAVSLAAAFCRSRNNHPAISPIATELSFTDRSIKDRRQALVHQLRERLEESVSEGELPENANVESMSALCMSVLNGLVFCIQDDVPAASLRDSVRLFVESLGFHGVRPLRRCARRSPVVLEFVRK